MNQIFDTDLKDDYKVDLESCIKIDEVIENKCKIIWNGFLINLENYKETILTLVFTKQSSNY